jgi:hypothetical protein
MPSRWPSLAAHKDPPDWQGSEQGTVTDIVLAYYAVNQPSVLMQ